MPVTAKERAWAIARRLAKDCPASIVQREAQAIEADFTSHAEAARAEAFEEAITVLVTEEKRLHDVGECPHVGERPACWVGVNLIRARAKEPR